MIPLIIIKKTLVLPIPYPSDTFQRNPVIQVIQLRQEEHIMQQAKVEAV